MVDPDQRGGDRRHGVAVDRLTRNDRLLAAIRQAGPRASRATLARMLGVSKPRIHQIVKRAVEDNAVAVEPGATDRGRVSLRTYVSGEEPPESYGDWNRTERHDNALAAVRTLGPMASIKQIAEHMGCCVGLAHRVLAELELAGEIERPGTAWSRRPIIIIDDAKAA
ncbi:helix-turn-helix domain-containing protein [Thalassobaculum sp.]|uniref:MarR family transcriptional regulator n=1 Tax=Thalassobaculum sp. TaxID=2022740 RepID=UPI0032EF76D3